MFATKLRRGCLVLTLVLPTTIALAQEGRNDYGPPAVDYRPVPPLPPDLNFTYHHASTVTEGWLRGQAALLHATGNYWLSLSQALICREQARWLALDNRRRWVEYRIWLRAWHELDRQRRVDEKRVANSARRSSKYGAYLLGPDELDRATGRIAWPELLHAVEYNGQRQRLDALFQARAGSNATKGDEIEIDRSVERLIRELRRHTREVDRNDYLATQDFLRGLKYESELGTQIN